MLKPVVEHFTGKLNGKERLNEWYVGPIMYAACVRKVYITCALPCTRVCICMHAHAHMGGLYKVQAHVCQMV